MKKSKELSKKLNISEGLASDILKRLKQLEEKERIHNKL